MRVLVYDALDTKKIRAFGSIKAALERGDFRAADAKKIDHNLYRAKVDKSNRLLFTLRQYQGEMVVLLLEYIENHAYDKSRFLSRNAVIDEEKIPNITSPEPNDQEAVAYLNPRTESFHLLDKILSFDEDQEQIYHLPAPLIIIGSAGSGKTALTLEKMKQATGEVLYVTRSPYLVNNAQSVYYAHRFANEKQEVTFLSFEDYLASLRVPHGSEISLREFTQWFLQQRIPGIKDPHQVFEEFRGVLTGHGTKHPWYSQAEYLSLGVKQSIFPEEQRPAVYSLFERYLRLLQEGKFYDSNILSWQYLNDVTPSYDFIVIDEVQDFTNIQLQVILAALHNTSQFLLCGDSHQIVHPNFFSWSNLKTYFYQKKATRKDQDIIRVLSTNYRNSPEVTEIANRILKLKNVRFGSIDKESNYLVSSTSTHLGAVYLLSKQESLLRNLDQKTALSVKYAVIVMHHEQKAQAKMFFKTPLVFSIQEAKGLEYENVILIDFVSDETARFQNICHGVNTQDLQQSLTFARPRDKSDKSLEIYKFTINALYVAFTRAVRNIYLIESHPEHPLFPLLGLKNWEGALDLNKQGSSLEEWRAEAARLQQQGKDEQADEIRSKILHQKSIEWEVLSSSAVKKLIEKGEKKALLLAFEYAALYDDNYLISVLKRKKFAPADNVEKAGKIIAQKYLFPYDLKNTNAVDRLIDKYGVDFRDQFNHTPLMNATLVGNHQIVTHLLARGAERTLVNNLGHTPFQIALRKAAKNSIYAQHKLHSLFFELQPPAITTQVMGRLLKLHNSSGEFYLLNLIFACFEQLVGIAHGHRTLGISAAAIEQIVSWLPDTVIPPYRKKRTYISSLLAKNTINSRSRYNRMLFMRQTTGFYLLNPTLKLKVDGCWVDIYDLCDFHRSQYRYFVTTPSSDKEYSDEFTEYFHRDRLELIEHTTKYLKGNQKIIETQLQEGRQPFGVTTEE